MEKYKGSGGKGSDKAGITSGTTFITPCPKELPKGMRSSKKSQKPLANESTPAARGHTIK